MSDIKSRLQQLEEERDLIDAATAGPWRAVGVLHQENQGIGMPLVESHTGFPAICVHSQDSKFIAHARTALKQRNEQLEAALKWAEKHASRACAESLFRAIEDVS